MNSKTISIDSPDFLQRAARPRRLDRVARRIVLGKLGELEFGEITLIDGDWSETFGSADESFPHAATIQVKSPLFYSDVAFGGTVGAGEAYIHDHWEASDLVLLGRILLRNRDVLDNMEGGAALLMRPLRKAFHWLNRNTRRGSERNIAAHYDLGNDFYALWLDPEMMYSSAWYQDETTSLEDAAVAKLDRICRRLQLEPGERVVEIGTGWGGFAVHAAKNYGCHVTTTTISREQHAYARQRIEAEGLGDTVLRCC